MNKLDILKKVLGIIIKSLSDSDRTIDNNFSQVDSEPILQDDSRALILMNDTSDVETIKELSRNFAKELNERDFEHLDGRAEYYLYTVGHLIELIKNNDEQNTIKLFNDNKIKCKYEDCEFLSINFNGEEQAEVVYTVIICVVSAEDKYFKELNKKNDKKNRISSGTSFSTTYTLLVKKEKGIWKIDKFAASEKNTKMGKN